jgi:hypothetical protein
MVKQHTSVRDQVQSTRTHHLQTRTTVTLYHHLQNKHRPQQLRSRMDPEKRLFVPRHRQIHGILMVLTLSTDISWLLKITGNLLQEAISGILANTRNRHISHQMNTLERYYREPLRTWMLNVNMAALLMMTGLQTLTVVMEMTDVKCLRSRIRRNGREISAIEPKRVA